MSAGAQGLETRGLAGLGMRRAATVVLHVCVWAQYSALLLELREMSRAHGLSVIAWTLPVIYPVPWILSVVFRKQINRALAQQLMNARVANLCSDWITLTTIVSYVVLLVFTGLHSG